MKREIDYAYAVARVRANELKLLSESDIDQLIAAEDYKATMPVGVIVKAMEKQDMQSILKTTSMKHGIFLLKFSVRIFMILTYSS